MEEIEFESNNKHSAAQYVAYVPQTAKTLLLTGSAGYPLLGEDAGGPKSPAVYVVDGRRLAVSLCLRDADGGECVAEAPLAMCKYLSPTPENIYNTEICREATMKNAAREQHNTFIGKVITAFFKENGCGSSCGAMTLPPAPEDWCRRRVEELKKLKSDKLGCAKKAVEYLAGIGKYCGRDFDFDDAFDRANDEAFASECQRRAVAGKVRVRLEGRPPSWWDGLSPQDSSGARVKWARGEGHTFLTPDIYVTRDVEPLLLPPAPATAPAPVAGEDEPNPFEAVFSYENDVKCLSWGWEAVQDESAGPSVEEADDGAEEKEEDEEVVVGESVDYCEYGSVED